MVSINPEMYLPDRLRYILPRIYTCKVSCQGTYTVAILNDEEVGVAKCNPTDKYDVQVGVRIALARAARRLLWESGQ